MVPRSVESLCIVTPRCARRGRPTVDSLRPCGDSHVASTELLCKAEGAQTCRSEQYPGGSTLVYSLCMHIKASSIEGLVQTSRSF